LNAGDTEKYVSLQVDEKEVLQQKKPSGKAGE
jgi:hypothetical protein